MYWALRDLAAFLSHLGITEADLADFSEQEISNSLQVKGIVDPAEIARVKKAWREQRQRWLFSDLTLFDIRVFLPFCFDYKHPRFSWFSCLISDDIICVFSIFFSSISLFSSAAQPPPPPPYDVLWNKSWGGGSPYPVREFNDTIAPPSVPSEEEESLVTACT